MQNDSFSPTVAAERANECFAQLHVRPFDFSGRPMQGMVYVDNGALADPEVLRTWVQRGTDYVAAHPAAAKRRKGGKPA